MRTPELGDSVRIASTPETIAAGYADRMGTCYGSTTPSVTAVSVIGPAVEDHALNVRFDDGATAWFDPSLVTFVDVNAGQIAVVGNKRFVRLPSGEWVEAPSESN